MPSSNDFRIIVVGAGPVGLATGCMLAKAGIAFVILERRPTVVEETGASVCLWPHAVRVLDQLGLLDAARAIWFPSHLKVILEASNGSELASSNLFDLIEQNHGHPWMLFHRARLIEMLYENLPDKKNRVLTGKEVVGIDTLSDRVSVRCKDGTITEGSMVLGADGVHGKTRKLMKLLANHSKPDTITDDENPFVTTYQAMYGYGPLIPGMEPGVIHEARGKNHSFQLLIGKTMGHWVVYRKLLQPTSERHQYTVSDEEELAKQMEDLYISKDLQFKQVWGARKWCRLVDLEEGMLQKWYWNRIVLLGDAALKVTPNIGLGLNTGIQSATFLVNQLHSAAMANPNPTSEALEEVFFDYQKTQLKSAKEILDLSALVTKTCAWSNWALMVADKYISPIVGGDKTLMNLVVSPIIKKGLVLDFLEEKERKPCKVQWVNINQTVRG